MRSSFIVAAILFFPPGFALAQGVVSPDTEPSDRTIGTKDAKSSSSVPGAGTVLGRDMSNGGTPGRPDLPPAPVPRKSDH